jgi:hypothetical protein
MNELLKKSTVILVCLTFLISAYSVSSASISHSKPVKNDDSDVLTITEQVTLLRYGLDGTIIPVTVDIILEEGQDLDEAIADKCEEMMEEDVEIQNFFKGFGNNNTTKNETFGMLKKVKSRGTGFHFKMKRQICIKKKLISLSLPKIHTWIPLMYCDYSKDPRANTTISPIFGKDINATKYVEGNHTILVIRFVGFARWSGRFSFKPVDMQPRTVSGISMFVRCKPMVN